MGRAWSCIGAVAVFAASAGCNALSGVDGFSFDRTSSSSSSGGGGGTVAPCAGGADVVLAIYPVLLGETDRSGMASSDAWKDYGLDIDGKSSTAQSVDLCQPSSLASPDNVYPDGTAGIDNSFGRNVIPLVTTIIATPSSEVSQSILAGGPTILLKIDQLGDTETCTAVTKLYEGEKLGMPAAFDGTDAWPVSAETLDVAGDIESAKNVFQASEIVQGAFDSGPEATFSFIVLILNVPVRFTIHHARLVMMLDPDHKGAMLGNLGGVLDTEEFVAEFQRAAALFDSTLCSGPVIDGIVLGIRQASDILNDGTQDPTKICNGISIGIGFEMQAATLGPIVDPDVLPPNPCP